MDTSNGWQKVDKSIKKDFEFKDFKVAFAFMTAVAAVAEELQHHPDWSNSYNKVSVSLSSHDAGKVTAKDTQLAAKIDEIAAHIEEPG